MLEMIHLVQKKSKKKTSHSKSGATKHGTPFTLMWLWDFYNHFEDQLLPSQKNVFDKVFEGMNDEEQSIEKSTASKWHKSKCIEIVHQILARDGK